MLTLVSISLPNSHENLTIPDPQSSLIRQYGGLVLSNMVEGQLPITIYMNYFTISLAGAYSVGKSFNFEVPVHPLDALLGVTPNNVSIATSASGIFGRIAVASFQSAMQSLLSEPFLVILDDTSVCNINGGCQMSLEINNVGGPLGASFANPNTPVAPAFTTACTAGVAETFLHLCPNGTHINSTCDGLFVGSIVSTCPHTVSRAACARLAINTPMQDSCTTISFDNFTTACECFVQEQDLSAAYVPTFYPSPQPSFVPTMSPTIAYCGSYATSHTQSAVRNYGTCVIDACGTTMITANGCRPGCNGTDQLFNLFDMITGDKVATNDDGAGSNCGACSLLTYPVTLGMDASGFDICRQYELREGCYKDASCTGTVEITGATISRPSAHPTPAPSSRPTAAPSTLQPSTPTAHPTALTYCTYAANGTRSDTINYEVCGVYACGGTTIGADGCSTHKCQGDQYLMLFNSAGVKLAENDDGTGFSGDCQKCSKFSYAIPASTICQFYEVREGCYGEESCNGTVFITGGTVLTPRHFPTAAPTVSPTSHRRQLGEVYPASGSVTFATVKGKSLVFPASTFHPIHHTKNPNWINHTSWGLAVFVVFLTLAVILCALVAYYVLFGFGKKRVTKKAKQIDDSGVVSNPNPVAGAEAVVTGGEDESDEIPNPSSTVEPDRGAMVPEKSFEGWW